MEPSLWSPPRAVNKSMITLTIRCNGNKEYDHIIFIILDHINNYEIESFLESCFSSNESHFQTWSLGALLWKGLVLNLHVFVCLEIHVIHPDVLKLHYNSIIDHDDNIIVMTKLDIEVVNSASSHKQPYPKGYCFSIYHSHPPEGMVSQWVIGVFILPYARIT
jgi:hypothetical protein